MTQKTVQFRETQLGEIADFTNGGAWNQSEYAEEGIPVVRVTNVQKGTVDLTDSPFLPEESYDKYKKHKLAHGDLIICTVGSHPTQQGSVVGRPGLVPRSASGAFLNQNAVCVRPSSGALDKRWLGYFAKSAVFKAYIEGCARGSANQVRMAIGLLKQMPVRLPPLPIQQKIASILSPYDDLIENNERRIKVLEEMAQNLYREWFVSFRFPGHEKVKMVDSALGKIPEGWEVLKLGDVLSGLESGKRPKGGAAEVVGVAIPSVGAENIRGVGVYNFTKEKHVTREFYEGMRKGKITNQDVLVYKDGAYIGRSSYFRDGFPHAECCVNEHVFILRTTEKLTPNFLYLWVAQDSTVAAMRSTNANAAQPGLNQKGMKGLNILLPTSELMPAFDKHAEPIFALVVRLAKRNKALRRTRDLLLPKLIPGQIDVSELDIEIAEDAA